MLACYTELLPLQSLMFLLLFLLLLFWVVVVPVIDRHVSSVSVVSFSLRSVSAVPALALPGGCGVRGAVIVAAAAPSAADSISKQTRKTKSPLRTVRQVRS